MPTFKPGPFKAQSELPFWQQNAQLKIRTAMLVHYNRTTLPDNINMTNQTGNFAKEISLSATVSTITDQNSTASKNIADTPMTVSNVKPVTQHINVREKCTNSMIMKNVKVTGDPMKFHSNVDGQELKEDSNHRIGGSGDRTTLPTPIRGARMAALLKQNNYSDSHYISTGLKVGFRIGYVGNHKSVYAKNSRSVLDNHKAAKEKIWSEFTPASG